MNEPVIMVYAHLAKEEDLDHCNFIFVGGGDLNTWGSVASLQSRKWGILPTTLFCNSVMV